FASIGKEDRVADHAAVKIDVRFRYRGHTDKLFRHIRHRGEQSLEKRRDVKIRIEKGSRRREARGSMRKTAGTFSTSSFSFTSLAMAELAKRSAGCRMAFNNQQ